MYNSNNNNNNQDLSSSTEIHQEKNQINSNIFENCAFVFDKTINLKRKNQLIKIIKKNGGKSCYSCTKDTHLITTKEGYLEKTQKVEQALSLGIPILVKEFVHDCVLKKELIPVETFLVSFLTSNASILSSSQELEVKSNDVYKNMLSSVNKVNLDDNTVTTTETTKNSSPIISLIALEEINGNSANTAQCNQQFLEAENQALKDKIKEIEYEFKCYKIAKENLEIEKDLEIKKLKEVQRYNSTVKESLLRDLENRCKEVIDLEFILEEYQARNAKLTDRLKSSNKPDGSDEEKKIIQTKLDQMTTLKIQLDNENTQLNSEIEGLKKLHSLRGHHIFGLENNISSNQESQSKIPINHQNQTILNEGIKNELEGVKSKKSEKLGARIARFFRCGRSNSGSAKLESNNSNKSSTSKLPSSSSSNNSTSPSTFYKNNNTSPLVPPPHLPPLPAWRYKYISLVLPNSLAKPSSGVQNL
ncbi:hypothetical protein DICPUDRAFT_82744 [Dictyostelium purpureum]|uniref:BRCT domain-containing protein n=1 Tax=Dictyostelium purpureum TaxID=5786 RepID=F0ZXG1_DICPU|nr:uncharacterized protein DICPUDRAFT_82744 [Dictyostelium purpureum]EGC31365.1 hypothetical protein DICPUDRAFT_82744 [Dictyostelium purpureum]|eukprot:XP_003292113.1 hypothetical protein DICPUDRAFT_82744 [Dictyostelium purpureum]